MNIRIDPHAGFCSGVIRAIKVAETELESKGQLYSLGDIVHNESEVARLAKKGLKVVSYNEFEKLKDATVLIRAHGEPPKTYEIAAENDITLIDASCKVVLRLQDKIKNAYSKGQNGQILIFGKKDHPEVVGLSGQLKTRVIIISKIDDLEFVDFSKPIRLFAQTTISVHDFRAIVKEITNRLDGNADFKFEESICKQVSGREFSMAQFAEDNDVVVFVGGRKSSNARFLFNICKSSNQQSYFIHDKSELNIEWIDGVKSIGVSGATSTPRWQMEEVKFKIEEILCI